MASENLDLVVYAKLRKVLTPKASDDESITLPSDQESALISIEALDASDNPLPIFVYQVEVFDPTAVAEEDQVAAFFSNVCSPNDIQELTVGIPDDSDVVKFRHHKITALCRSVNEANWIWEEVQLDVQSLIDHQKLLADPPTDTTQEDEIELS